MTSATIGIGSLGTIGSRVAQAIVQDPNLGSLQVVSARDHERAAQKLRDLGSDAKVVEMADLAMADIVIECAPALIFREIAMPAIQQGKTLIPASVAGLLANPDVIACAQETGARIIVPSGAIMGLDAVRAMAKGQISSAKITTRKAPRSLAGAPYFDGRDFDPDAITEPTTIFAGTTIEAAKAFPANVNVAVALALAGAGPSKTMVEIVADPAAKVNTHQIEVHGDVARLVMSIDVLPSPENPKSSTLTPMSIVAALESLTAPLRVGS
jgi:aspartate dehydrogenase